MKHDSDYPYIPNEDDDYTPENVSGASINNLKLLLGVVVVIAFLILYGLWADRKQPRESHIVIDTTTVSIAERPATKVYVKTEYSYFYPGDTVSSKENGALILWEKWMGEELIVGVISDSGTIETIK